MFTEFLLVSFATFIEWQALRSCLWFKVPERVTTFLVLSLATATTFLSKPSFLIALAATGGCAVLFRFIAEDGIGPWKLDFFNKKKARSLTETRRRYGLENRIPRL